MQVRIEFQVRRRTLHSDHRAALRALARAAAQAAVIPAEDGVNKQPRAAAMLMIISRPPGRGASRARPCKHAPVRVGVE